MLCLVVALFTIMKCHIFRLGTNGVGFVWLHTTTPTQNMIMSDPICIRSMHVEKFSCMVNVFKM